MTKSTNRIKRIEERKRKLATFESFSKKEYAKLLKFDLYVDLVRLNYSKTESIPIIIELIKKIDL